MTPKGEGRVAAAEESQGLDCDAEALEGVRAILRARLEDMFDLRETALRWEEIEGVHKMRAASSLNRDLRLTHGPWSGEVLTLWLPKS